EILNTRAALLAADLWGYVTGIMFGKYSVERKWLGANRTVFKKDNADGWVVAITTDRDIRPLLRSARDFVYQSPRLKHHEAAWTYKQVGADIVIHLAGYLPPAEGIIGVHFDAGGGRLSVRHMRDWWRNTGVSQEEVTRGLAKTPAAQYLRGISADLD